MSKEFKFDSFDSTTLFGTSDVPTSPKAVVLVVHGLCEHLGRYDYLTARLNAQQYAVYRFDHRGHGRSEGQRVYYDDFNQ
ncbi:MAG: lysophospholipase, partial [Propionibacteriaceae bacterium]|nr:lysophospholipase [Propionibacteriaceae bacterium]